MSDDDLITATQAAKLLSVAHSTFRAYAARGLILPAANYGGEGHGARPMYRRADVLALRRPRVGKPPRER